MSPFKHEVLNGEKFDPERFLSLKDKKVFGFIYWNEPNSLQAFEDKLLEMMTKTNPKGFYTGARSQKLWSERRAEERAKYGEDALVNLFPEQGHQAFTHFLNTLSRQKIYTVPQLIAKEDKLQDIENLGKSGKSKSLRAARLIVDYFKKPSPAARA